MNLLIVDDDATNLKLLRALLEAEGHTVFEAVDGVEALAVLARETMDAVISDILMPRMDGYGLCYQVRTQPRFAQLPFIIYTSTYTSPSDEKLSLEFGADKFLRKPAPPKDIARALHEVMQAPRRPPKLIQPPQELHLMKEYNEVLVAKLEEKNIELLRRADELQVAHEKLHQLLAHSPAVLYTLALDGAKVTPVVVSDNIERLLGVTVRDVTYDWWLESLHPQDRDRVLTDFAKGVAQGGYSMEYRIRHQDGSYRWVQDDIRVLRGDSSQPKEAVGVWTDLTERKSLEEQFHQAQKMEAFGQLAGGVAHDFNNLLTVILGYTDLLLGTGHLDDSARNKITQIHKAGERAASLTRQLLAFSRKQVLEPRVLDLNAIIIDTEKMLHRLIGEDVTLTSVLQPDIGRVKVDPGQMEQVIMNLAVNARDAMPQGGKLTIETANVDLDQTYAETHPEVAPGRYVLMAVSDTGCGMDHATKARIFEPFFTTKEQGKGTGLGLATVFGIVKQSGGHIAVYSEPEHGTTFKVYLPVATEKMSLGKSSQGVRKTSKGNETILLVEDEDGVRGLARLALQMFGYTVLEASNGAEAINMCEQHPGPIHLVVSDVVMPEMGGRRLIERLTALRPGIKVLFFSGYTDDAVMRHGVLEAEVAFLQKPFTPAALSSKVREVLDQ